MVKDKKKTKAELILVTGLVIVAVCIYLYLHFVGAVKGAKVQILVDGVVTQEYDLYSNQTVAIETENGGQIKYLKPGQEPKAEFITEDKPIAVYEYCNLHGLWKKDL